MKRLLRWIIAVVIFQAGIYLYIDQVTCRPVTSFTQQEVESDSQPGADVYFSFDKKYYAEVRSDSVSVFNTRDRSLVKSLPLEKNEVISYFHWLPERELALIGVDRDDSNKTTTVMLKTINPEHDNDPVIPEIKALASGARLVDVAYSTRTNVINMLIKSGKKALVYRTDANNKLRQVNLKTYNIGRIANLQNQDVLVFDRTDVGQIYRVDSYGNIYQLLPKGNKYALLGVDSNDNIYVCQLEGSNYGSTIMMGKLNGQFSQVKKLPSPYPVDDIEIGQDGQINLL